MECAQLVIKNANYYTAGTFLQGDIVIVDGKIVAIIASGRYSGNFIAERVIDASGYTVLPGLIDSHVHFREPGHTEREDFFSGSCAAAAGGFTAYRVMPNVNPPPFDTAHLNDCVILAEQKSIVDFMILAAAGFDNKQNFSQLLNAGVVGFKTFLQPPPVGKEQEFFGLTAADDGELFLMLQAGAASNGRFYFHAENHQLIKALEKYLHVTGQEDNSFHYQSHAAVAEIESVATVLNFAKATGCKIGFVHITLPESCELIKQARGQGVDVVTETCFHYLLFDNSYIDRFGPYAKCNPPLRDQAAREGLWHYLFDGTIDMIGSDHAPFTVTEKAIDPKQGIWQAPSGIPAIEVMLPLMLDQVAQGRLKLADIARLFSENTAKAHGLYPRKGCIDLGSDGDFTIVDTGSRQKISREKMYTKARDINIMFEGMETTGMPVYTIVRGRVVMDHGQVDKNARGWGNHLRPEIIC